MGNQLRALEAGLAVARVLGRVLVVPDYISDNGEGMWVRYDAIWEFGFLEELIGRDKVILQATFDAIINSDAEVKSSHAVIHKTRLLVIFCTSKYLLPFAPVE